MTPRLLVAGVGNIFLGDDGFGVAVAQRLLADAFPGPVRVADFGIRGVHLAYELLNGYDSFILIDATPRGSAPGTVYVIEPDLDGAAPVAANGAPSPAVDAHSLDPAAVFAMVKALGGEIKRVLIVGCEPATVAEGIGLSDPVAGAVDEAVKVVRELIAVELAVEMVAAGVGGGHRTDTGNQEERR
ncbi:MAG: hydrogenase maturation protease [Chloroflexia bacterium]|nr:hydrogenase maturation protease [Chloroflexia bacterium]MDQ3410904.1 hydrogenase maturation protease [Chloroflexota bacterium]